MTSITRRQKKRSNEWEIGLTRQVTMVRNNEGEQSWLWRSLLLSCAHGNIFTIALPLQCRNHAELCIQVAIWWIICSPFVEVNFECPIKCCHWKIKTLAPSSGKKIMLEAVYYLDSRKDKQITKQTDEPTSRIRFPVLRGRQTASWLSGHVW